MAETSDRSKTTLPKCHDCGRFMRTTKPGVAWKMVYSGYPPGPDREIFRCVPCVEKFGTFIPQSGIKPEHSCGVVS